MDLKTYIIRRLMLLIPTLLGVSFMIFVILQIFDPIERASVYVRDPKQLRYVDRIIKRYHLDAPFYVQFYYWLREVLRGNLGWSRAFMMPVSKAIIEFFPATAELVLYSAPLTIWLGIKLGTISAVYKDRWPDHLTRVLSIIGWSMPSFWLGIILMAVFYGWLKLFPPGRLSVEAAAYVHSSKFVQYTGLYTIDALLNGELWIFFDALRHLVLPVITLTTIQVALLVRLMRSSMLEELGKVYVIAARARGLSEDEVVNKHAKRNALIPVITASGLLVAGMLTGVVITETVFNFNGLGYWAAHAATQLDIPAVLGFALFSGVVFVISNLIVDILYAYIDPRIKF